jgi:hypothetical protein
MSARWEHCVCQRAWSQRKHVISSKPCADLFVQEVICLVSLNLITVSLNTPQQQSYKRRRAYRQRLKKVVYREKFSHCGFFVCLFFKLFGIFALFDIVYVFAACVGLDRETNSLRLANISQTPSNFQMHNRKNLPLGLY